MNHIKVIEYLNNNDIKIYSYMTFEYLKKLKRHHKTYNFNKYPECMKEYILDVDKKYQWKLHELRTYIFECIEWTLRYQFFTEEKKYVIDRVVQWTQNYSNLPIITCNWLVRVLYKCMNSQNKYVKELFQYTDLINLEKYESNYILDSFFKRRVWLKIYFFYVETFIDMYKENENNLKIWTLQNNMKNTYYIKNDKIFLHPFVELCFISFFVK